MFRLNNKRSTVIRGLISGLLMVGLLGGCGKQSPAELRAEASQFRQKGDLNAALISLKNAVGHTPDDADTRFQLASVYIDNGDPVTAEKEIRLALRLGSKPDAAMPILGKALVQQGQFQKALDETAQIAGKSGADLLCVRGDAHLALGQLDQARQLYDQVLQTQPGHGAALVGLGRVAFVGRDAETAHKYADRALASAPRNTDALLFKGDLLRAQNQAEQALAKYDQVLQINPAHRTAHIEKAYLQIGLGRFAAAQAEVDAAKATTPGSVLVAYTQSLLDFSQGKHAAAQESMHKVLRVAPEHMPSVLLAGAISLNLGSLYQAENHLRHYLEKHPDNLQARKMLASTLLRRGHTPDALIVLRPALEEKQTDVQLLALAGESYMQIRDFENATVYFEKASSIAPNAPKLRTSLGLSKLGKGNQAEAISDLQAATKLDGNSQEAGFALVRTELSLHHVDNAFAAVVALEKAQPGAAAVQDLKGIVYIGMKDMAKARASFKKALSLQPSYFAAAANLAQLDLNEKNPAAARQHLLNFLDNNKSSREAMTALATLADSERKFDEATQWLEKAVAVEPDAIAPGVNLLAQYLRAGQTGKALGLARKLQVTNPDNPDLLDLLGKAQLANKEPGNALETYKTLSVALPRSAHAQMQVAALYMLMKNPTSAEDHLKTALAMQPDFPAAQLALAELYARKGSHELALLEAARLQRKYPKAAAGYQLEGDVLVGQNKVAQALPFYERALALSKTSELTIKTVHALRATGKQEQAAARLEQWLRQHPDDIRAHLFKGETLLADKQYAAAAEQLELTLKQQPNNVVGLNNLALAYQQAKDPRAQQVAEEAYKLAGDQPEIMDTLGWILVEKGDTARGLAILQKAQAQAPKARDIRFHIAAGHYKSGNTAAARKELEVLMAGDMRFAQADEARALLKQLQ
jgi:putative PEP-CTERM system TPR-repeat lipoprotein